jgi:hypothetical protein
MGKGWLLVILCDVKLLFLVFLLFFLCHQVIVIVFVESGSISYCNGFCGNNCDCAITIEYVVGIGTWNVTYKL